MKILIADDERLICEWLEFCIKENPEYEIVGIANNGEQALKMYKELSPDLVLTDIKMPVMDGLSLLREIKKINSSTYVVMLTAFSEFDYAREAMRENADEYILKTEISNQSFQEVLRSIASKIEDNKGENSDDMQYNSQKHSIVRSILVSERAITKEDINQLRKYKINWRDTGLFAIAVWKKKLLDHFIVPKNDNVRHVIGAEYNESIYVLVGNLSRELSDYEKICCLQEYANLLMHENNCMVGISNITNILQNINEAALEAVNSLSLGFYNEQMKLYRPSKTNKNIKQENETYSIELKRFYLEFLTLSGKEQYQFFVKILEYIEENKILDIKYIKTLCKESIDTIYLRYVIDNADFSKEAMLNVKEQIDEAIYFSEIKKICMEYAEKNIWNQDIDEKNLSQSIFKAVVFIQQHYKEAISLDQVAAEVNLNPEYLSRVFKEEMGYTYSTFLSNIRMKKAEYLLKNTDEKVQSIAEKVGYYNVSYFSTIFKKKYGVNPYEFRRKNANKYLH